MVRGTKIRGSETIGFRRVAIAALGGIVVWNLAASRAIRPASLPITTANPNQTYELTVSVQGWRVVPVLLSVEKLLLPAMANQGGGGQGGG